MRRLATIKSEVLDVTKGDFMISGSKQKIFANSVDLGLTSIEFRLLVVFINSQERVMSREEILTQVWVQTRTSRAGPSTATSIV